VGVGSRCALTMIKSPTMILVPLAVLLGITQVAVGFSILSHPKSSASALRAISSIADDNDDEVPITSRRSILTSAVSGAIILSGISPGPAHAVVGTLPELADTNAIVQGVTIDVVDKAQQDNMVAFLVNGFNFQVLRQRIKGSVQDTWLGFGPEQLSVPKDFEVPVSSFAMNGGHASINIRYDSQATSPLYRQGEKAPGDNIAFLQVGVGAYRISQMVQYGGNILDAYGFVNVVSPSGLPIRAIVGVSPDPMMFLAIYCVDVKKSKTYYEQLGFVEQEYPYGRLSKGQTPFEPEKPRNSVYMAPSPNCMGVLLIPSKKKSLTPNPVVRSLNVVYNPSEGNDGKDLTLKDLSDLPIQFQSVRDFTEVEEVTR
jgi:hypothetical protein